VEEIRRALLPDVRQALPVAIRAIDDELRPGGEDGHEALAVALGRQIGILKAGLAAEHKEDWIDLALAELHDLPSALVLDALTSVRRKARFEGDVVPMVIEIVEPQVAKLRTERKHVERLLEIAG
jgi:hypothetical protein